MGYAGYTRKIFSRRFMAFEAPELVVVAMAERGIVHGASLTQFLISCKKLPSEYR